MLFGDLFEQNGIRAIAVNEFFDSKIGKPVSDKSLHGMFLQKCFGGHPEPFDKQVDEQLKEIIGDEVEKIDGKTKSFPIGTTAIINANQDRYLVFALSKTNPNTCKADSNVSMMWDALHELWQRTRIESGGHDLNLPLIGSGLSGLGLPTRDLLNLIILSAITETKAKEITQRIRVILHRDRFDDLDLRDLKKHLGRKIMAYRNGTYVAFHANGTNIPGGNSDIDYYNLMRAWSAHPDDEFTINNSHEKVAAVSDSSKKETLKRSLIEKG